MKYSKDDRASILAFAIASGYPLKHGSKQYSHKITKVSPITLNKWFSNIDKYIGMELLEIKIMDLKHLIETELTNIFGQMENKRESASYRDLTTAAGILSDKLILLQGGVTNRTESISGSWKDIVEAAKLEDKTEPYKPEMEFKNSLSDNLLA